MSTSGASLGKVESINLDGSGRAVLLDRLDTPFGLAIDEEGKDICIFNLLPRA